MLVKKKKSLSKIYSLCLQPERISRLSKAAAHSKSQCCQECVLWFGVNFLFFFFFAFFFNQLYFLDQWVGLTCQISKPQHFRQGMSSTDSLCNGLHMDSLCIPKQEVWWFLVALGSLQSAETYHKLLFVDRCP